MAHRQPLSHQPKRVPPALLDTAKRVLERSAPSGSIRHSLQIDKSESFFSTEKMTLIANEGRTEPGYICFFPQQPVMFISGRQDQGVFLRLRVDSSLFQGTIFIGTLDGGSLVLEDCLSWRGKSFVDQPFSKRYAQLHTFFHTLCVRDERISGVKLSLAKLYTLSALADLVQKDEFWSVDFVPEIARRRRFFMRLHGGAVPSTQQKIQQQQQQQQQSFQPATAAVTVTEAPKTLVAIAKNIQGLPDTYDLFSYDKVHIGEGAIQSDQMSTDVRVAIKKNPSLPVFVEWNEEFECYEITGVPTEKVLIHKAALFKIVPQSSEMKTAEVAPQPVQRSHATSRSGGWLGIEE